LTLKPNFAIIISVRRSDMSKEQLDEFIVWLTTEVIEKNKDLSDDYGQGQATAFTQVIDYLRTVPKL